VEVAKHLSNLLPDQDYAPLGQLLANPHLPEDVLETLMADVMNRRNGLKLPALLGVARTAQHPKPLMPKKCLDSSSKPIMEMIGPNGGRKCKNGLTKIPTRTNYDKSN